MMDASVSKTESYLMSNSIGVKKEKNREKKKDRDRGTATQIEKETTMEE